LEASACGGRPPLEMRIDNFVVRAGGPPPPARSARPRPSGPGGCSGPMPVVRRGVIKWSSRRRAPRSWCRGKGRVFRVRFQSILVCEVVVESNRRCPRSSDERPAPLEFPCTELYVGQAAAVGQRITIRWLFGDFSRASSSSMKWNGASADSLWKIRGLVSDPRGGTYRCRHWADSSGPIGTAPLPVCLCAAVCGPQTARRPRDNASEDRGRLITAQLLCDHFCARRRCASAARRGGAIDGRTRGSHSATGRHASADMRNNSRPSTAQRGV